MKMIDAIERRPAKRPCYCRGCDKKVLPGTEMITTYSWRGRGQFIHFCIECSEVIGNLAKGNA